MRTVNSSSRLSRGGSASVHAGIPTPPNQAPPQTRHPLGLGTPPDQLPPQPGPSPRDQAPPPTVDRQTPVKT